MLSRALRGDVLYDASFVRIYGCSSGLDKDMSISFQQFPKHEDSSTQLSQRRKFLGTLAFGAGALALGGCGGGSDAANPGAVAADAVDKAAKNASSTTVLTDTSFGVKGDGKTNDRAALQKAIDGTVGQILLITGASRIDATGLTLHTNSHIRFASGASIKLLAHNTASYQILRVWDAQNVTIENPTVDGSKELNSAVNDPNDGGAGMGISIAGSTTINITTPTTINCWGDGIYISNSYRTLTTVSSGVTITGHHATGCRRQGASIIGGNNITFQDPIWENISGTLPSAGLDIEPNSNNNVLQNIKIINPTTNNCKVGILVYLAQLPGPKPQVVTIDISNHHDTAARDTAFEVGGLKLNGHSVTGHVASNSPTFTHSKHGFEKDDWDNAGPSVEVTNVTTVK